MAVKDETWPDRVVFHRYGLPVNFQAMLLQPNKKNMKKLREVLYDLYKHLDSSAAIIDVSLKLLEGVMAGFVSSLSTTHFWYSNT